jgi:hypothetical protein
MAGMDMKKLAAVMKKNGATPVPNENTYVATAQDQAAQGDQQGAMDTMQYSVQNPAADQIDAQAEQKMRENDPKTNKKYKEYIKALQNAKKNMPAPSAGSSN